LPKYIIHVSDGAQKEMVITARDEAQATEMALTALGVHISQTFPPPQNLTIVVKDGQLNERATLRFSYEASEARNMSRSLQ
jgi:hypothetical protein